jgi:hypothetical protein
MKTVASDHIPAIEAVQQQFESWRSDRGRQRGLIPEHLWESAVLLCQKYSITHVSRFLRLSYSDLKRRTGKFKEPAPRFMEIDLSGFSGKWQVECERPDGARLRVSATGPAPVEQMLGQFLS